VGIGPEMTACADTPEQLAALTLHAMQQTVLQTPGLPFTIEKAADDYQRLFRIFDW
jgi:hypothetical protein